MITIKYFKHEDTDGLTDFLRVTAPRASKDNGGITIAPGGLFITFEDGEPFSKLEQISYVKELIRGARTEIVNAEPDVHMKKAEQKKLQKEVAHIEKKLEKLDSENNTTKAHRQVIKELQDELEAKNAILGGVEDFLMVSERNKQQRIEKIAGCQKVIEDIESGALSI